jgi:hypothetical protein
VGWYEEEEPGKGRRREGEGAGTRGQDNGWSSALTEIGTVANAIQRLCKKRLSKIYKSPMLVSVYSRIFKTFDTITEAKISFGDVCLKLNVDIPGTIFNIFSLWVGGRKLYSISAKKLRARLFFLEFFIFPENCD